MVNKLGNATSPYLLQHANNPVDWHEWSAEALQRARVEDKPILLSIGYAACHWCHVMERESFEDHETAALMNQHFVSIKVDREERPDLDAIYMDAVQTMTGHGGWPMTMFLAPDGTPLYGGTYYPPEDRHGMPSFRRVLTSVAQAWTQQREDLLAQGAKLVESMGRFNGMRADADVAREPILEESFATMTRAFDQQWGGFGRAPKFPQPMNLEFLLRCVRREYSGADRMLATTLTRMARGGIFDHVAGGFARYSVDGQWLVPHFEKMLYDNAQLLRLYTRAALVADAGPGSAITQDAPLYRQTAIRTGEYLLREMRAPGGGFYSSQDADSEGAEGRFAVWSEQEFRAIAGADADAAAALYAVSAEGNWEGHNVLWIPNEPLEVAKHLRITAQDLDEAAERARTALYSARRTRVQPGIDDKVLAGWNGMAASGLLEAGRAFDRADFIDAGIGAIDFVLQSLRRKDGRLLRSWREDRTSGPAFLEDYALVATACLDAYQTIFDETYFTHARTLADQMIALFADEASGGFYDTGSDAERLVVRPKDLFDNAVPCGNSAATLLLSRLAALTGDSTYRAYAEQALSQVVGVLAKAPLGFGVWLCALDDAAAGIKEVAIAGAAHDPAGAEALRRVVWTRPHVPWVLASAHEGATVPLSEGRQLINQQATAYVCRDFACELPVTNPADLEKLLDG